MLAHLKQLKKIVREEGALYGLNIEREARSSVTMAQGVSALIAVIFVAFQIVSIIYKGGLDLRLIYLIPVIIVVAAGPIATFLQKQGYIEFLGKYWLLIQHTIMIFLALWLDCLTDPSLCVVYTPLFIAVAPVMLLRSFKTELALNTTALILYIICALLNKTPISPDHAILTALVAYCLSLFALIAVTSMRNTITKASFDLAAETEERKKLEEVSGIAAALSYDFLNVYSINLETNKGRVIKLNGYKTKGYDFNNNQQINYGELVSLYIKNRVHPDDKERMTELLSIERVKQELAKSDAYIDSYRILDENGETHYYQFRYIRVEQTGEVIAGFRCVDVTMRYELRQRLALEEALNAAQRANVAKTTFVNSVSHDLRTPMNAIMGFTSRASSNINKPEVVEDALAHINGAARQLLNYVGTVLDVTDQSGNRLGFITSQFSLPELIDETEAKFARQIDEKEINFSVKYCNVADDAVKADRARLARVLYVLLENAVLYTSKGGTIELNVAETNRVNAERARFIFEFKDTGVGIPPKVLEHIFDPFAEERIAASEAQNTVDLGLPLVKTMVEASGGSIDIKSEEGKGTDVVVVLPLGVPSLAQDGFETSDGKKPAQNTTTSPAQNTAKAAQKPSARSSLQAALTAVGQEENELLGAHILVVDDNALNREIACDLLSEAGFACDTAESGAEAVAKFEESMPGYYRAVLMDILMPGMDGMQATSAIRRLTRTDAKKVAIVALSANMSSVDAEKAMAAGMNAFLNKPFQVDEFMRVLQNI